MVKRILTFQVICAMLLCAVPTLAEPAPPSEGQPTPKNAPATVLTEIFHSPDGKLSFYYPRGWAVTDYPAINGWIIANNLQTATAVVTRSGDTPPHSFVMVVGVCEAASCQDISPPQILDQFLPFLAQGAEEDEGLTFGEMVELFIGGRRAARVSLNYTEGTEQGIAIALELGGALMIVGAFAEKADYVVFEPIMYEMLATFEYSG